MSLKTLHNFLLLIATYFCLRRVLVIISKYFSYLKLTIAFSPFLSCIGLSVVKEFLIYCLSPYYRNLVLKVPLKVLPSGQIGWNFVSDIFFDANMNIVLQSIPATFSARKYQNHHLFTSHEILSRLQRFRGRQDY